MTQNFCTLDAQPICHICAFHTHMHNRFTALFPWLPGWAGARRNLLVDFMVQGKITWGRHTDNPDGRHSIQINQRPTSIIPHFYAGCPSCRNSLNLSWLATDTKYHAFWRGSVSALQWTIKCWTLLTVAWVSVVYTSVVCCMLSDVLLTKCNFHLLYESQLYLGIDVYMSSWDGCRCYNYGRPA